MNAGNESDPHKGQVLWSFLTIDVVGPGNLRGSFLYGEKKKNKPSPFYYYIWVYVQQGFCFLHFNHGYIYIYIYIYNIIKPTNPT